MTEQMKIVISLSSSRQFSTVPVSEADAIEVRLDLITEPIANEMKKLISVFNGPVILTLRSSDEGGAFAGSPEGWMERISPFLEYVTHVDIEKRYSMYADTLRGKGKTVIASYHINEMPSSPEFARYVQDLRAFGDIPKIAVQPQTTEDLLDLLRYTHITEKPLIVSVTGTLFRYARALLPLFGSMFVYTYIDSPTSPGQYSFREMRMLAMLLTPGKIDPWFEGRPVRSGNLQDYLDQAEIVRRDLGMK